MAPMESMHHPCIVIVPIANVSNLPIAKNSLGGPSIKYVTLFLTNFDPLPLSHFVTHPGTPLPRFLVGLVQKTRTKSPCTNSLTIVCGGFCQGVFCLEGFVRGGFCPFPFLLKYICYNRKLKNTLNFMFHVYDKKNL